MEKKRLTPLKEIISQLFNSQTENSCLSDGEVLETWDKVVGPGISKNARPYFIKDKVLTVTVSDPIWLQELNFLKQEIRAKLNQRLGREAVCEIRFMTGRQWSDRPAPIKGA